MYGNVRYVASMDAVADFIRRQQRRIAALWELEIRRDAPIAAPSRPVLIDHVPAFLGALADWIEGDVEGAEQTFQELTEGPALLELGYGVGLETLTRELSKLRVVLVRELLAALPADGSLVRLQQAMDNAIDDSIRRYAARREEVRERFIGILGHDLRDPLSTVIISARTLASNQHIDREHRLAAARIVRACNRMQRMINDVLDFARGHLGTGIPAYPMAADMGEICRAATDEMIAAHPQRTIQLETSGDLHGAFDRDRVHQAMTNLLANAIHHGEGAIDVRVHGGDAIVTEVTSHGAPIPESLRAQIFDPFAHSEGSAGLGLGLYIVHQIAAAHGAHCDVSSDANGTTFRIRWPRRELKQRVAG